MDSFAITDKPVWQQLRELAGNSTRLFVKKLSRNDTSWADDPRKHQAGFYIPRDVRESDFFPPLVAYKRDKPHIFHATCFSFWPQTGEVKKSGMRHYSNKGPETHFTVVPKGLFSGLGPGSLLVSGRLKTPIKACALHWFIVLDSESEESELLETALDLSADFQTGLFDPVALDNGSRFEETQLVELIQEIESALKAGTLEELLKTLAVLPSPADLSRQARAAYLSLTGETDLDPFRIPNPGDAIMLLSRDIEYRIFRRYELRRRAAEVIKILSEGKRGLADAVVRNFQALDSVFLSASQQRKTRAGRSFEFHIASALTDGRIAFEEQAVTAGRRPDFVIPDLATLKRKHRNYADADVIAAKTTLRDRWKGLRSEALNCQVYLATVDDRVMTPVIDELERDGITLVVPERLKTSEECFYSTHSNAITFKELFVERLGRHPRRSR